jgi:hypothetical protein
VNLLVYSLSLHRHSYIGFILDFASSIHNKQTRIKTLYFIILPLSTQLPSQELWLPQDDLRDSFSWSSPPLMLLRDIHSKILGQYGCKEEVCAQSQSQVNVGAGAGLYSQSQVNIGAGPRPSSQDDGVPQEQETATLMLPQLNRLIETSFVRDENSASTTDATAVPSQIGSPNRYSATGSPSRISN